MSPLVRVILAGAVFWLLRKKKPTVSAAGLPVIAPAPPETIAIGTVFGFTVPNAMILGLPITQTNNWKVVGSNADTWLQSTEAMQSFRIPTVQLLATQKVIVAAPGETDAIPGAMMVGYPG